MNGVVSTCGNKRREKKSGVRNALGQETSDVFFYVIKRGVNHQEKYACKALLVRKFILHPFYEGLVVKPFFGMRGFGLAFLHLFESSEFGDAKHSRTEDDLQLDLAPCPIL